MNRTKMKVLLSLIALILCFALSFTSCDQPPVDNSGNNGITNGEQNGELNQGGNTDNNGTTDSDGTGNGGTNDNTGIGGGESDNEGSGNSGVTDKVEYKDVNVLGYTVPAYSGNEYYILNNNKPFFEESEIVTESFERYDSLDSLGRCTVTMACLGRDLMPTDQRGDIGSVTPTGWIQSSYSVVPGGYLYNRCHLIGWQLTDEDANEKNLITGTKYMNTAMIPFENMIADYIKETNNHVMYRVRPIFEGNNLLCSGVLMEAYSVEDEGEGICFNIFMYNVQPNVNIDYSNGKSNAVGTKPSDEEFVVNAYILNTNTKKIHEPDCTHASKIADKNREEYEGDIDELLDQGYTKCGTCNPS